MKQIHTRGTRARTHTNTHAKTHTAGISSKVAKSRGTAILERIDSNPLARTVPTWVSERLYEGNFSRPLGGTGDSVCGMGRFAWFNALARKHVRTPASREFFMNNVSDFDCGFEF